MRAFQRLDAAIAEIAAAATPALERAVADADHGATTGIVGELARAAFTRLRRLLIDLGAPEAPPAKPGPVDRGYVLACYADEALLHLVRWPGAALWPGMLLERSLYGTEIAGERLLETAERMVALIEPSRRDVAAALFLAIAAGFRGGCRGTAHEPDLGRLQSGLFDIAMDRAAPQRLGLRHRLSQATDHTINTPRRAPSRAIERAAGALILVIAIWLVSTHVLWHSSHAEMTKLADHVIAASRAHLARY